MDEFGFTLEQRSKIIEILKSHLLAQSGVRVYLFGSRANKKFKKYSDVDLLIESEPELSEVKLSQLKLAFEESSLPYQFDLITPARLLDAYREGIQREKIVFYEYN